MSSGSIGDEAIADPRLGLDNLRMRGIGRDSKGPRTGRLRTARLPDQRRCGPRRDRRPEPATTVGDGEGGWGLTAVEHDQDASAVNGRLLGFQATLPEGAFGNGREELCNSLPEGCKRPRLPISRQDSARSSLADHGMNRINLGSPDRQRLSSRAFRQRRAPCAMQPSHCWRFR